MQNMLQHSDCGLKAASTSHDKRNRDILCTTCVLHVKMGSLAVSYLLDVITAEPAWLSVYLTMCDTLKLY